MELTTAECLGILKGINEIKMSAIGVKTAFKFLKIQDSLKVINDSVGRIEHDLVEECADLEASKDAPEGQIRLREDKAEKYHSTLAETMAEVVEVDIAPVPLDEIGEIEVTIETLSQLRPILE